MANVATVVDSIPEPRPTLGQDDTDNHSSRRGRSRKRKSGESVTTENGTNGKKRTFDDFFNFCSFVLAYEEQLERQAVGKVESSVGRTQENRLNSSNDHAHSTSNDTTDHPNTTRVDHSHEGTTQAPQSNLATSTAGSSSSMSESSESGDEEDEEEEGERGGSSPGTSKESSNEERLEYTSEDESWNLVTCFCRRPFAGRPMIECSKCNTWVHLFCAKIRKSAVPDVYTCPKCASLSSSKPSSNGINSRRTALASRK